MKIELEIPDILTQAIAERVVASLKLLLNNKDTKASEEWLRKGGDLNKHLEGGDSASIEQTVRHNALPIVGYIRLKEVLAVIPVSRATWYKGIADGRYPKPTKRFGSRIAAWDVSDIRALLDDKAV